MPFDVTSYTETKINKQKKPPQNNNPKQMKVQGKR